MGDKIVADLLLKIRNGDETAFESLAEKYKPLILSAATKYEAVSRENGVSGIFADLSQELTLALYRAAKTYNVDQDKVTFGNYAKKCINNCAISFLRKSLSAARRERKVRNTLKTEQRAHGLIPDISEKDAKSILDAAAKILSRYEYSIFADYIAGEPVRNIAVKAGRDAKSVSNALFRCKTKIKRYCEEPKSQ